MQIIDEREMQKNKTKRDKKRTSETVAMVKEWELNDFAVCLS